MMSLRNGFLVVGCVFVGFVASAGPGLVAQAAEPQGWVGRVTAGAGNTLPADDGEARLRIVQLEQRLQALEAERRAATPVEPARSAAHGELDAVIARNQELTARNRALAAENQALSQRQLFEPPARGCESAPEDANPKAQLRYWAERLRDGDNGFRSRLTAEQSAALNVLLRRERPLDPSNPWRQQ